MSTSGLDKGSLRAAVEAFARERLGCNCPDSVFAHILVEDAGSGVWRIDIGGRLLIDLAPGRNAASAHWVYERLAAGLADRDRRGMNRYRLVLGADEADQAWHAACAEGAPSALARFADDRIHLHCLPRADVEALQAVCRSALREAHGQLTADG
ncbi:MAG: hypothetical protein K9L70_06300 [Thiohalocapsa sp.]|nr:hypothetical protein [Thiohalocapsa sp.]